MNIANWLDAAGLRYPKRPALFEGRRQVANYGAFVDLVHAGSLNAIGARRRSLLISYFADPLYASHLETVGLRNIRMDTSERFDPADFALKGDSNNA